MGRYNIWIKVYIKQPTCDSFSFLMLSDLCKSTIS